MNWLDKYKLAIDYARAYNYEYAKDITHDAWVRHYQKYSTDLFEVPVKNSYIYKSIKYAFFRWLHRERIYDSKGESRIYFDANELQSILASPEEAVIGQDLYQLFVSRLEKEITGTKTASEKSKETYRNVFMLRSQDYATDAIAEKLNITKGLVNYYNKKMSLINPFRGNNLKVTRTISKETWDKKSDKADYERDDWNEWFELYRHKESNQGILVRLMK